jgi:hypothetical protein
VTTPYLTSVYFKYSQNRDKQQLNLPHLILPKRSMPDKLTQKTTTQDTTARYLKKVSLQALLERLFPGQTEFNIQVNWPCAQPSSALLTRRMHGQMKDDQWCFTAPRRVEDVSHRDLFEGAAQDSVTNNLLHCRPRSSKDRRHWVFNNLPY